MANRVVLGNAGLLTPGKWLWLRSLVWLCLLIVLAALTFNLAADGVLRIAGWLSGTPFTTRAAAPDAARLIAVVMASIAMIVVYALAVRLGERRSAPEIAPARLVPELIAGLAIGGGLIAAIVTTMAAFGWVSISPATIAAIAPSIKEAIQSGVIEEVIMRLIIFRLLWRSFGVWPALLATAALFGGLHLSNPDASLFAAACLTAGEGVGAGLYMLTGRVWLSIGVHAGWNFTQGWVFGGVVSGLDRFGGGPLATRPTEGVAPMLSGGGFGPESSLAALVISLAASAACLGLAWRAGGFRAAEDSVSGLSRPNAMPVSPAPPQPR